MTRKIYRKIIALNPSADFVGSVIPGRDLTAAYPALQYTDAARYPLKLVRLAMMARAGLPVAPGLLIQQQQVDRFGVMPLVEHIGARFQFQPLIIRGMDDDMSWMAGKGSSQVASEHSTPSDLGRMMTEILSDALDKGLTQRPRVAAILPYLDTDYALTLLKEHPPMASLPTMALVHPYHQASHSGLITLYPDGRIEVSVTSGSRAPTRSEVDRTIFFDPTTSTWLSTGHFPETLLGQIRDHAATVKKIFASYEPANASLVLEYSANLVGIPDSPPIQYHQVRPVYSPLNERPVDPILNPTVIRWAGHPLPLVGKPVVIESLSDLSQIKYDSMVFIPRNLLATEGIHDYIKVTPRSLITQPIARKSHAGLQLENFRSFSMFTDQYDVLVQLIKTTAPAVVALREQLDPISGVSTIGVELTNQMMKESALLTQQNESVFAAEQLSRQALAQMAPDDFERIPGQEYVHREMNGLHVFFHPFKRFERIRDDQLSESLLNDLRLTFMVFPGGIAVCPDEQSHNRMRGWVADAGFKMPLRVLRGSNRLGDQEYGLKHDNGSHLLHLSNQYAGDDEVYIEKPTELIPLLATLKKTGIPFDRVYFLFERVKMEDLLREMHRSGMFSREEMMQVGGLQVYKVGNDTFISRIFEHNLIASTNPSLSDQRFVLEQYRLMESSTDKPPGALKPLRPGVYNVSIYNLGSPLYQPIIDFYIDHGWI